MTKKYDTTQYSVMKIKLCILALQAIIEHFLKLQKRVTNFGVMLGGSTDRLCTPSTSAGPFRIFAVTGFQNRANDIVYCPPIRPTGSENAEDSTAVVYFGGDVQVCSPL